MSRGTYIRTKEHNENISKSLTGRKLSPKHIENLKQSQNRLEVREKKRVGNLGKKRTLEQIERYRQSNIGRKQFPEHIEKCRQSKIGSKRTPETKEKQRQAKLGKKQSSEHIENNKIAHLGYKQSIEHIENRRKSNTGKKRTPEQIENLRRGNLHMFSALDHLLKDQYCILWTEELKESVRLRDSYICQNCGITQEEHKIKSGKRLTSHHIHYLKSDCYPDLITLCSGCNLKANHNRDEWEKYYMNKLNDRKLLFWTKNRNKEV